MDSSGGALFEVLRVITLFLFLIPSMYADDLQSPMICFNIGGLGTRCRRNVTYPMEISFLSSISCGYPGFIVNCDVYNFEGEPFMNFSNHLYRVSEIRYEDKVINIIDMDVNRSVCPQPSRNFSFPSSPSWINYHLPTGKNVTIFTNCSTVPPADAKQHLLCSQEDYESNNHTKPSYAFYEGENLMGFDWYRDCENVIVPVNSYHTALNYSDAVKSGFYMGWSATEWCETCELSGGQCWSNSTATGCACKNFKSYNTTCPPGTSPRDKGVLPTPSPTLEHRKHGPSTGLKIGIGVSSGIGLGVLLVALPIYCKGFKHSFLKIFHGRKKHKSPINVEVFLEKYGCLGLKRYRYSEIRKMTNSFKDSLGQGGYGKVFKGELRDGRLVAVKQLNESKGDGEDFINEVATIGTTNHVNVVNLVGFCIEGTRRALVYEFMPNGSLERFIYTQKESSTTLPLGWEKLYHIALGIARGLEYLHRGCNTRILHFDIKPHNILLDQNFCPKISDFGLAKLYPSRESIVSTVGARGTMGYIAPELCYREFGNVSHKSDVYSYGMMVLEMVGGRKNIDATVNNISEIYFPIWIYNHFKQIYDAKGLEEIQSSEMFGDENAKKMILVALWCIQAHPVDRPSMNKVVEMLEGNTHEVQMPPKPSVDPRSSFSTSS